MRNTLEQLRNRLNNLNRKNRTYRLLKLKRSEIDLAQFDELNLKNIPKSKEILKHIVEDKSIKEFIVTPANSTETEVMQLIDSLKEVHRIVKGIKEETGVRNFYLGYPFVNGHLHDGTFVQAPLVLYPISLGKESGKWIIQFEEESRPILNRTLILAIQKYNEIIIDNKVFEDVSKIKNPMNAKEYKDLFESYGIKIQMPQSFKLKPFKSFEKKEIEKLQLTDLTLVPNAIMGYFEQGKKGIFSDYEELLKKIDDNEEFGLLQTLLSQNDTDNFQEIPPDDINIDAINEEENFFLTKTDLSQEEAILSVRRNKGLIIDGPPGTGKSQVIVNLIADAISKNQKVMLVCEKKAALDVVYQRLDEFGLSDHVGLINDAKDDRKAVFAKIGSLINQNIDEVDEQVQKEFVKLSKDISYSSDYLNKIAHSLWKDNNCGLKLFELYDKNLKYNNLNSSFNINSLPNDTTYNDLVQEEETIRLLGNDYSKYRTEKHPWSKRKCFSELTLIQQEEIRNILKDINQLLIDEEKMLQQLSPEKVYKWDKPLKTGLKRTEAFSKNRLFSRWLLKFWMKSKGKSILSFLSIENTNPEETSLVELNQRLQELVLYKENIICIKEKIETLHKFLENNEVEFIIDNFMNGNSVQKQISQMIEAFNADIDNIIQFDRKVKGLSSLGRKIYDICKKQKVDMEGEDNLGEFWWGSIEKAVLTKWIQEIEIENPKVQDISSDEYDRIKEKLMNGIENKREVAARYLNLKLINKAKLIPYPESKKRKLIRETVGKQRNLWSIRKMLEHFPEITDHLIPVWFVNPESASTIFPLKKDMFDLVIFDEASQCPVENGIPSFFRAKKVVVAGDDQQLKPDQTFKTAYYVDEDDEENYNEDIETTESLLEFASITLPRKRLQWHYRAKFEELINFSNHAFYKDLQVAPNVKPYADPPAIEWIDTDGEWNNQRNVKEAERVVQVISEKVKSNPTSSLGVVTFNKNQAMVIEELLKRENERDPEFATLYQEIMSGPLDKRVTVKNIENIQGDERDVMIFSIAYARDRHGNLSSNFGTLNKEGGENRLNVAITRAVKKMIIVCSIHPDELRVNENNKGPYLFKQFLRYALSIHHVRRHVQCRI